MQLRGGTIVQLNHDPVAGVVSLRVEGGQFNRSHDPGGWGTGDFTLLFTRVAAFAGEAGGALSFFGEDEVAPSRGRVTLASAGGVAMWEGATGTITWFVPRRDE